ncbi:MAG TPA: MBL fold metallo-hydrolase [Longimicrobiaceae bacterium]
MEITFLGGTGTVTGSKYLVTARGRTVLVDCGLFQGLKQLRLRNREPFPVPPASVDAVILTHAHLDHSGYLPLLVRDGFRGPVYCTPATRDLCGVLLPDSGHLQEEEARFAAKHGYSRHRPPLPLYTREDAERSLDSLRGVALGEDVELGGGLRFCFHPAGHMLGAATVTLTDGDTTLAFSGDLGRLHDPLLPPPAPLPGADHLVVESTYGDRLHAPDDPEDELAETIRRTAARGGVVLIPAFAVGRAQAILLHVHRLRAGGRIPDIPVYLDSPMAAQATRVFQAHARELRLSPAECEAVCRTAETTESVEESKRIDRMQVPRVVISASGMATGGRVLHHLKVFAPDPANTVLFAGYQAAGTRGADMVAGARSVKIHGQNVPVRAEVAMLDNVSAHADYAEILEWLGWMERPPRSVFVTHGEPVASDALRRRIQDRFGWDCRVPEHRERVDLG